MKPPAKRGKNKSFKESLVEKIGFTSYDMRYVLDENLRLKAKFSGYLKAEIRDYREILEEFADLSCLYLEVGKDYPCYCIYCRCRKVLTKYKEPK